jgi:hypothetical protein
MVVAPGKVTTLSSWQNFAVGTYHLAFSMDGIVIKCIEFAQLADNVRDGGVDGYDTRTITEQMLPLGN